MDVWTQILNKLTSLDLWSLGIGVILTVATFFIISYIRKRKARA